MRRSLLALAFVAVLAEPVLAGSFTVFNTGVADDGSLLSAGDEDPHWSLVAAPPGKDYGLPRAAKVAAPYLPYWLPVTPSSVSMWINPDGLTGTNEPGTPLGSEFVYRTTFDLAGFDPASASITFRMAFDDWIQDVLVNGVSQGITNKSLGTFGFFTEYTVTSGFRSGENSLSFLLGNWSTGQGSPTGLRVEFLAAAATATAVPLPPAAVPGVLLLFVLALSLLLRGRRDAFEPR